MVLYPNIPSETGLNAMKEALDNENRQTIPTNLLLKINAFVTRFNC